MTDTVLTIAGFDGSGGAGIQADLKTFSALGCYGTTVLTALPIQNTVGVRSVYSISPACVKEQMEAVLDDIQIDTIKIGMLHCEKIIEVVASVLERYQVSHVVLDPVMVAKSGDALLLPEAITAMKKQLLPLATVLTPNLLEASHLLERTIENKAQMEEGIVELMKWGPKAIVIKGGHLEGTCEDCLCMQSSQNEMHWFSEARIPTKNTHGTGCTFSAAIAAFLARGLTIFEAVRQAKQYLTRSIQAGINMGIGKGNGPVHHFHHLWPLLQESK